MEPAWEVALLFPPQGNWSAHEYLALADGSVRIVEFNRGYIEVHEMPTIAHQRILRFLMAVFSAFVSDRRLGEMFFAALPLRLNEEKFREPDLIFVGRSEPADATENYLSAASLVLEVVSSDLKSRQRDLVEKRREYAVAGITEYWIVDPQEKRITVLTLDGQAYAVHGEFAPGQQATSRLLAGLSIDVAATFQAAENPT
ncbi:MAG: Uma2 family endonuclease [Pirellulales bacterium]|nr:Uma2 family endonuclease [Pirellulales bacterium]